MLCAISTVPVRGLQGPPQVAGGGVLLGQVFSERKTPQLDMNYGRSHSWQCKRKNVPGKGNGPWHGRYFCAPRWHMCSGVSGFQPTYQSLNFPWLGLIPTPLCKTAYTLCVAVTVCRPSMLPSAHPPSPGVKAAMCHVRYVPCSLHYESVSVSFHHAFCFSLDNLPCCSP